MNVTVWNEFLHEREKAEVRAVYPEGIHTALLAGLAPLVPQAKFSAATLEEPEHGLTEERLAATEVLLWWGHMAHDRVADEVVDRVQRRVLEGMGLIALHSAHASKIFRRLMGTGCMLRWREAAEREILWVVDPSHPIVEGITGDHFELEHAEMYGEPFDIPPPEELLLLSWFAGGEVFRSGCTFRRGKGKIFYFRPGHETYPIYYNANVLRVIANAIRWAAPAGAPYFGEGRHVPNPLAPLPR